MQAMSIEQRVRETLMQDDNGAGPVQRAWGEAPGDLSERERKLCDWGLIFGACFALAREENPWESIESVAQRALEPARAVFRSHDGNFNPELFEVGS